jgi:hypothetical protein
MRCQRLKSSEAAMHGKDGLTSKSLPFYLVCKRQRKPKHRLRRSNCLIFTEILRIQASWLRWGGFFTFADR